MRRERREGGGPGADTAAGPPARRGTLFVVATPIGHLDDLSPRAVETLRRCGLVACEDTRVSRAILGRHAIRSAVISCHRHNERARTERLLATLADGVDVALLCDGGTPGLSDPGAEVVRAARQAGAPIVPIPGPSAVTTLWSVSGFPSGPFTVFGFLPQRVGERRRMLESLRDEPRPLLFFESPHRILATLSDARDVLGDRQAFLGREMTKIHEEYLSGPLSAIHETLAARVVRGEFTLIIAAGAPSSRARADGSPAGPATAAEGAVQDRGQALQDAVIQVLHLVAGGMERREALRRVARATGLARRDIYASLARRRSRPADPSAEEE